MWVASLGWIVVKTRIFFPLLRKQSRQFALRDGCRATVLIEWPFHLRSISSKRKHTA